MQVFLEFLALSLSALVSHAFNFLRLSLSMASTQVHASAELFCALTHFLNASLNFVAASRHPFKVELMVAFS